MSDPNEPPKDSVRVIPEGFTYSREAKEDLRKRASAAKRALDQRLEGDDELRQRVGTLLKAANDE